MLDFHRLPFWPSMKLIFICWLILPYFNGAAYVYQKYVRPFFVKNQMVNIWYVPQQKGLLGKSDDFLRTLDKFIEENGTDALKKLANKVHEPYTYFLSSTIYIYAHFIHCT
jgi:receptor expression-enhancing protein 5/6